jgi:hypothetical protein
VTMPHPVISTILPWCFRRVPRDDWLVMGDAIAQRPDSDHAK